MDNSRNRLVEIILPVYIATPALYPIINRCLESLHEYYPDISVRVVDDGSPEAFPQEWLEYIDVIQKQFDNRGYVRTVNHGLASSEADILIVANDDLVFKKGDLDRFYGLADMVIASPADTASSPDDRFGAIFGMTRNTYMLLGPLDESYVHFYADLEYYDRAKQTGVTIEKWPEIVVDHSESATYKHVNKNELLAKDEKTYRTAYPTNW